MIKKILLSLASLVLVMGIGVAINDYFVRARHPKHIAQLIPFLVTEKDLPPMWHLGFGPKEISRGNIFDYCINLETSYYLEVNRGYFDQNLYSCQSAVSAKWSYDSLLEYPLDKEWLDRFHIDLQEIHADEWDFGCEELDSDNASGYACEGLFRYDEYLTYISLNPPLEFVDLDGIIDIVYLVDQKMSESLEE